jgi:hypothetical protein
MDSERILCSKNGTQRDEVAGAAGGNFFSVEKKAADAIVGRLVMAIL